MALNFSHMYFEKEYKKIKENLEQYCIDYIKELRANPCGNDALMADVFENMLKGVE